MTTFTNSISKRIVRVPLPNKDPYRFYLCYECEDQYGLDFMCPWYGWCQDLTHMSNCIMCNKIKAILWQRCGYNMNITELGCNMLFSTV